VRLWRTEKTVSGFCYSVYIGNCLKKANDASAKLNNPENGQHFAALLSGAVRVVKLPERN
jgi:hypothetical protein